MMPNICMRFSLQAKKSVVLQQRFRLCHTLNLAMLICAFKVCGCNTGGSDCVAAKRGTAAAREPQTGAA